MIPLLFSFFRMWIFYEWENKKKFKDRREGIFDIISLERKLRGVGYSSTSSRNRFKFPF